jgi:hypothetical protein
LACWSQIPKTKWPPSGCSETMLVHCTHHR